MERRSNEALDQMRDVLLETYAVNDAMNQLILDQLDSGAWRAKPPGRNARTIAAIFAHVHNVRRKWLRLSAPHLKLPAQLESHPLHTTPGRRCAGGKRPALLGNACGSPGAASGSRQAIPPRRLGQTVARWRRDVCLHGFA